MFTKGLSVTGRLGSSFSFKDSEERDRFIREDLPLLEEKYGKLNYTLSDLPGLQIGDTCKVWGEGDEEFIIEGIKLYSKDRPGFILDSGWCEEVYKCYK